MSHPFARILRAGSAHAVLAMLVAVPWSILPAHAGDPATKPAAAEDELQVEVNKKGLGKEVVIKKGDREWYMMIEVTQDNTVVVRQEKDKDTYVLDESETHDRGMTKAEVDVAIEDFINSVKTQVKNKK
jgi:hypothetical protein